jgi:hypothetical protein
MLRPGCGGFFIDIKVGLLAQSRLVVVDQFNVKGIGALKTEDNAPVRPDSDGSEAFQPALQGMQSITGEVHGLRCFGFVESGENVFHSVA